MVKYLQDQPKFRHYQAGYLVTLPLAMAFPESCRVVSCAYGKACSMSEIASRRRRGCRGLGRRSAGKSPRPPAQCIAPQPI